MLLSCEIKTNVLKYTGSKNKMIWFTIMNLKQQKLSFQSIAKYNRLVNYNFWSIYPFSYNRNSPNITLKYIFRKLPTLQVHKTVKMNVCLIARKPRFHTPDHTLIQGIISDQTSHNISLQLIILPVL